MGAKLLGDNIVFLDNLIVHPVYTGDDTDGIRFFGDHIKIVQNTIADISEGSNCTNDGCGDGPHPDCMQTWYSDNYPTSSDIVIEGNRCEKAAAQCLMAEGPMLPDEGVSGPGQSANWVFHNNYCDDWRQPGSDDQEHQERDNHEQRLSGHEQQGHRARGRVYRGLRPWQSSESPYRQIDHFRRRRRGERLRRASAQRLG